MAAEDAVETGQLAEAGIQDPSADRQIAAGPAHALSAGQTEIGFGFAK
jgi:hypothetical protein